MNHRALGTISILCSDRHNSSEAMNKLLTKQGHHIMARLGVNVVQKCLDHCPGLIALAVDSTREELEAVTRELNAISDIKATLCIMLEE